MLSLNRLSSRNDQEDSKSERNSRRKSLTNYTHQPLKNASVSEPLQTKTSPSESNFYENNPQDKAAYDRLRNSFHSNNSTSQVCEHEPEPDYWDLPYNNNLNNLKVDYTSGSSCHEEVEKKSNLSKIKKNKKHHQMATKSQSTSSCEDPSSAQTHAVKKAISLAEVIVKSISTSSSSNSSMLSSSNVAVAALTRNSQDLLLPNKVPVDKIVKKKINNSFSSNKSASAVSNSSSSSNNEEIIVQKTVQIEVVLNYV